MNLQIKAQHDNSPFIKISAKYKERNNSTYTFIL